MRENLSIVSVSLRVYRASMSWVPVHWPHSVPWARREVPGPVVPRLRRLWRREDDTGSEDEGGAGSAGGQGAGRVCEGVDERARGDIRVSTGAWRGEAVRGSRRAGPRRPANFGGREERPWRCDGHVGGGQVQGRARLWGRRAS